jgi:hypothetical protein
VTDREFRERVAQLLADLERRMARLRAAEDGDLGYRVVTVKAHVVPSFKVRRHKRLIIIKKAA